MEEKKMTYKYDPTYEIAIVDETTGMAVARAKDPVALDLPLAACESQVKMLDVAAGFKAVVFEYRNVEYSDGSAETKERIVMKSDEWDQAAKSAHGFKSLKKIEESGSWRKALVDPFIKHCVYCSMNAYSIKMDEDTFYEILGMCRDMFWNDDLGELSLYKMADACCEAYEDSGPTGNPWDFVG